MSTLISTIDCYAFTVNTFINVYYYYLDVFYETIAILVSTLAVYI